MKNVYEVAEGGTERGNAWGSPRPAEAQALRLNSGRDGGVHRRPPSSPLKGEPPRFCLPGGSTYALDVSPSQGDARLPPAVATIPSPQGCSVGTVFSHQHLERAGVQPRHLVPERQAQVPRVQEVAEGEQASGLCRRAFGRRDRQIPSTCRGESRAVCARAQVPAGATAGTGIALLLF